MYHVIPSRCLREHLRNYDVRIQMEPDELSGKWSGTLTRMLPSNIIHLGLHPSLRIALHLLQLTRISC
jgi:hypothetical protein